ncbi:HEPN domain-containing protein [Candidatus Woesearchaeota archaeon]|nr:HEPN domain-containing protein [Candidatus Woesearchaeota archaeon]
MVLRKRSDSYKSKVGETLDYTSIVSLKVKKYFELEVILEDNSKKKLVINYLEKSRHNLLLAKFIKEGTNSVKVLQELGFDSGFKAFDWVTNASYYAMYMAAQAALASIGIKCENHTATPFALEYFFVFKNKLEKEFIELLRKNQGLIEEKDVKKLREGKDARQHVQYDITKSMEEKEALVVLEEAGLFINRMEQLISAFSD